MTRYQRHTLAAVALLATLLAASARVSTAESLYEDDRAKAFRLETAIDTVKGKSGDSLTTDTRGSRARESRAEVNADLRISIGETHVLSEPDLKRLVVGNGKIVSAKSLESRQVLLLGRQQGSTTLHLWFHDGSQRKLTVRVDASGHDELLRDVRSWLGRDSSISARVVGHQVVIEGMARTVAEAQRIRELAQRSPSIVNLVQQSGVEQMIAMEVRFLEVKKSALENIGINWQKSASGPVFGVVGDFKTNRVYRPSSTGTLDSSGAPGLIPNMPGGGTDPGPLRRVAPFAMYFGLQSTLTSVIQLMEQSGDAIVLAEPILSCRSGGAARFLAGGEIPLPSTSALGGTSVQFKPYGIKFEINPTLTESGRISARVMTELSTVDQAIKVGDLPAFLSRQTETEVNLDEGETLVISGLISEDRSKTIDQLAGLANIPVLGRLFQSKDFRERRSEMIVFVTPRFIKPGGGLNQQLTDRANQRLEDVQRSINQGRDTK
jgi:pilus assembly protein CpaC